MCADECDGVEAERECGHACLEGYVGGSVRCAAGGEWEVEPSAHPAALFSAIVEPPLKLKREEFTTPAAARDDAKQVYLGLEAVADLAERTADKTEVEYA